jgi:hypothetical protein
MRDNIVNRIFVFALAIAFANIAIAQDQFDTPDTQLESQLYDINQRFNSEPVAEDEWLNLLGSRRSESYRIQTGDTLWDISSTFFGDGRYWPKLWSENSRIENPHQILPRKQIQFLAGTMAEMPVFNVVDVTEVAPSAPTYVSPDVQDDDLIDPEEPRVVGGKPVIPKSAKQTAPPLSSLPPSFEMPVPPVFGSYDSTGLDVSEVKNRAPAKTEQLIPFLLLQTVPSSVGVVSEIELSEHFAGTGQYVLVRLDNDANVGDQFSIFYNVGKLANAHSSTGQIIEVGGRIEIKSAINGETNVYRAIVIDSVNPIRKNALLSLMKLPTVNFVIDRAASSTVAKVIGGEFDRLRRILGLGSVVYLSSETGSLSPGEILTVQATRKSRKDHTKYPQAKLPVAVVKVANVDGDLATAVVINSLEEIAPGDVTGGPLPQADTGTIRDLQAKEITNSK